MTPIRVDRAQALKRHTMTTSISTSTTSNPTHEWNLVASIPFLGWHFLLPLAVFIPFKWEYVAVVIISYYLRMFGVTAGYHRYFAHRAFKTNRVFQFLLAFFAQMGVQKGVLWWAANHRHHHRYSDMENDIHSPARKGFWWSHMAWILLKDHEETNTSAIRDFAKYPELVWLNKHFLVPPLVGLAGVYALGGLPWAFYVGVVSTVLVWHGTFTINSLSHVFGSRRYLTTDTSRNNFLLALLTCGEGWHNNHHFHQNTANQGWFWWEIDFTFYALKVLSWFGIVSDLRVVSDQTKNSYRAYSEAQRAQLKAQTEFNAWRASAKQKPRDTADERPPIGMTPAMAKR
jgi:stearoyl-CoA desaturase (Delta-9 desaturase)